MRAYVVDVRKSPKGPQVVLSRAAEGLVQRLLEMEVPEIADGIVEIMAIAREAGSRSKVAVRTHLRAEVDPIGACLGPKSSRIANVSDNLRGEKVDMIRWDADAGDVHHERARAGEGDLASNSSKTTASRWSSFRIISSRSRSDAKGRTCVWPPA